MRVPVLALSLLLVAAVTADLASVFGPQPVAIDLPALLLDLNMTHDELFRVEANDFVYTYSQSQAHFTGPRFDGHGFIDVHGCSGLQGVSCPGAGICRNNPAAECCKNCGPVSRGQYRISAEIVYHNMPHCYILSPIHYDCPSRNGFLIHGGDGTTCAAGNPTDGCVVIEDANVRRLIKGGGLLHVEK